jgi:hypothetical protein
MALPVPELKTLLGSDLCQRCSYGYDFPAQLAGNLKDITEKQKPVTPPS